VSQKAACHPLRKFPSLAEDVLVLLLNKSLPLTINSENPMHSIRYLFFGVMAVLSMTVSAVVSAEKAPASRGTGTGATLVYIGTYTGQKSQGIYVCRLDPATGALSKPELAAEMVNPSWVTIHPTGKFLYAAGESGPYPGGGAVTAFTIEQNGHLTLLNSQEPNGKGPCHLAIDQTGKTIVVSNYGDGSMSSLLIGHDGKLASSTWVDRYPTLGARQKPHAHHSAFDPGNRFALTCDAGLDRIWVYRFDASTGSLTANDPPYTSTTAETHPRHLTFSADGRFCYNIDEKAMSVTAFSFDGKRGVLQQIQAITTLPADFTGKAGSTAELVMHPSGRFLYGSNRGPDHIVGYSIDAKSGQLSLIGHTSTLGKTARSFGIDPSGQWMVVGNQNSDTMVQFRIDQSTGELTPTGTSFELGAPVCFQFLEVRQ
jgi:6-phosphogluconolactonase